MRIKIWVATDKVGSKTKSTFDVDDADWAEMTIDEREEEVFQAVMQHVEWGYEVDG